MTYQEIFDLKYKEGLSTFDIVKQYPNEINRVNKIAMLDIPEVVLRKVVQEEKELKELLHLKKKLHYQIASLSLSHKKSAA